ncbi:hypothetical protein MRS79_18775, partial [Escherichia coli]|uniref:hypothetical protein n=1 Tax=Escherichia coli TaxID=562 RepID=UPI001FA71561
RFLPFHAGKIVLHNLKLKAERIFTHKKLHLTSLSVQLLGCSSFGAVFLHGTKDQTFVIKW